MLSVCVCVKVKTTISITIIYKAFIALTLFWNVGSERGMIVEICGWPFNTKYSEHNYNVGQFNLNRK